MTYTTLLDTQRIQLLQDDLLIMAKGKVNLQLIAAYKPLGRGWENRSDETFISDETKQQMLERTNWGDLLQ